jgi:hypothetical protein
VHGRLYIARPASGSLLVESRPLSALCPLCVDLAWSAWSAFTTSRAPRRLARQCHPFSTTTTTVLGRLHVSGVSCVASEQFIGGRTAALERSAWSWEEERALHAPRARPVSVRPEQMCRVTLSALSRRKVSSVAEAAGGKVYETDVPKPMPKARGLTPSRTGVSHAGVATGFGGYRGRILAKPPILLFVTHL